VSTARRLVLSALAIAGTVGCEGVALDPFDAGPLGEPGADAGRPDAGHPDGGGAGAGGGSADAGSPDAGPPASSGADAGPCLACTDFEAAGSVTLSQPNCSGTGTAAVEAGPAHSGTHALHVHGVAGYCNHAFAQWTPTLPPRFWLRYWVRAQSAFGDGHLTFVALHDQAAGKDLRMGTQSKVLMFNRESDDATLPAMSPVGIAASVALVPGAWTCVEVGVDQPAGTLTTRVNGQPVAGLTLDAVATPDIDQQWKSIVWAPSLVDVRLGFESYANEANELWFDDLFVGETSPGCQ
jgi:hypothetical protein